MAFTVNTYFSRILFINIILTWFLLCRQTLSNSFALLDRATLATAYVIVQYYSQNSVDPSANEWYFLVTIIRLKFVYTQTRRICQVCCVTFSKDGWVEQITAKQWMNVCFELWRRRHLFFFSTCVNYSINSGLRLSSKI